jgi:hypothetical protein
MTPEGQVKSDCRKLLVAEGFVQSGMPEIKWPSNARGWFHMPAANGFGVQGLSDFILCDRGWFGLVECKGPGKREKPPTAGGPTHNQLQRMKEVRHVGGRTLVVDDVSQLKEWLDFWKGY